VQKRRRTITRAAPLAFFLRNDAPSLLEPFADDAPVDEHVSQQARAVLEHLQQRGASFLSDIAKATGILQTETEEALWELVASGVVTGDGIAGLRTLLLPAEKRKANRRPRATAHLRALPGRGAVRGSRMMPVGRWSLLRESQTLDTVADITRSHVERLLERYGVVFRDLCVRESRRLPWRVILHELRRLEACGAVRGGRFVDGFIGEQFALPDAVDLLRRVRRDQTPRAPILVCAADPLNLVGIVTPGERVSPFEQKVIAYRNGLPVEIGELGIVRSRLQAELR
jgi:ATP-dependent Lhr-like helicase